MEIATAIAAFLTHVRVEKGLSPNTVSAYRRDLLKFDEFGKKKKLTVESVTRDDLVDFLASLYRQKLESRTVARHLVTMRNFFRFALVQEYAHGRSLPEPGVAEDSPLASRLSAAGGSGEAAGAARREDSRWGCETAPCSKCCTRPACVFPNWWGCG